MGGGRVTLILNSALDEDEWAAISTDSLAAGKVPPDAYWLGSRVKSLVPTVYRTMTVKP
jgi:hypothetical protein